MPGSGDRKSLERALLEGEGSAPFAAWLDFLLSTDRLRLLVRRHAVPLKGFRAEKAPRAKLVDALARAGLEKQELRLALFDELGEREGPEESPPPPPPAPAPEPAAERKARESLAGDLARLRAEREALLAEGKILAGRLEKARRRGGEASARAERERKKRVRREEKLHRLEALLPKAREAENLERRCRKLEEENRRLRDAMAVQAGREREAMESAPPEAEREPPPVTAWENQVAVPHLEKEFHQSLAEYDAKTVARIFKALFRVCQDPAHTSLNFKKMSGRGDIYSIRATPALRIYFFREPGALRFLLAGDREEQDRSLRQLRERYEL